MRWCKTVTLRQLLRQACHTVVFDSIVVDRQLISSGTEIGLFDYDYLNDVEVCVGSYEYEGSQFPIQVTAWQSDLAQGLSGYQEGSPIIVKLWTTTYDTTIEFSPPISWTEGRYTVKGSLLPDIL